MGRSKQIDRQGFDRSAGASLLSYVTLVGVVSIVVVLGVANFEFAVESQYCKGINAVDIQNGVSRYSQYWTNTNPLVKINGEVICRKNPMGSHINSPFFRWYDYDISW